MNAPWIKEEDVPAFVAWLDLFAEGQRALGYKAALDAAINVVECEASQYAEPVWAVEIINDIAALPVPEVQWRDLTDDEILGCLLKWRQGEYELQIASAAIAKFKEKNT